MLSKLFIGVDKQKNLKQHHNGMLILKNEQMNKILYFSILILLFQSCKKTSSNNYEIFYKESPPAVIFFGNKGIKNDKAAEIFNKGLEFVKNNDLKKAKKEFLKADNIEPDNIVILSAIANVEGKLGNLSKSNRMFYDLISKDSTYTNLYNNLGLNLNNAKQYQEAKNVLLKGLKYTKKEKPQRKASYFLTLAATYKGLSDCENTLKFAKKGLTLGQNDFMRNFAKELISYAEKDCK